MKNLRHSNKNAFDTYQAILQRKNDGDLISRLTILEDVIREKYQQYEDHFASNSLEELTPLNSDKHQKDDLLKLYSFQGKVIKEIKKDIMAIDSERISNTCPLCTLGEIRDFDHYLPKASFSEFAVNPKNLFPSCSICNGHKGGSWKNEGGRLFLNLYLDLLPEDQYLFVNSKNEGTEITFYLENVTGINPQLFNIIESHYTKLHLLERFREASNDVISELVNALKANSKHSNLSKVVDAVIEAEEGNKKAFGFNYWKSILKIALVRNHEFLSRYAQKQEELGVKNAVINT